MTARAHLTSDLIVIGAGPAGARAAIAAARSGLATTLIDDAYAAGGQIYRAPPQAWRLEEGQMRVRISPLAPPCVPSWRFRALRTCMAIRSGR